MRTVWTMLAALLLSITLLDLGAIFITYDKIKSVTEHALDAALIAGIKAADARLGHLYIDEPLARQAAEDSFKENLNLNANWENSILKQTHFVITIHQDTNPSGPGTRPYVQGEVDTKVTAISPKLLGLEGIPIRVSKKQFQLSTYR